MNHGKEMAKCRKGEVFVETLNAHGVDKIFINPGFETIEFMSEVAATRAAGGKSPQMVLCLDESVAAAAAYGNFMVTGNIQVIMVHSEIGSLQLGGNLQNLQWGRVPAVILAADQEIDTGRTLWNGQPFDQASIVRNSVKYDRRVTDPDTDLHEVLTEAFRIANTTPKGPVYVSFPLWYLGGEQEQPESYEVAATEKLPPVDMVALEQMADILLQAQYPMLVSGNAGRFTENVAALVELAETLAMPTLTGYSWMNFPTNHPLCLGIEQIGGGRKTDAGYDIADVIIAIDYDEPYVNNAPPPKADAKILHIDYDQLTQGRKLYRCGADLFLKADARAVIPALTKLLKVKITAEKQAEIDARFKKVAEFNDNARQDWFVAAIEQSGDTPISPDYLCHCINQLIDADTIVINHTLSHCASVTEQIVREKPGTWFGCPSGAIGWAPGAALGAASAATEKPVVAVMTDGGFVWGCPTSTLWTAANYKFPFLAVICNNRGYGAVRDVQIDTMNAAFPAPDNAFWSEDVVDFAPNYAAISEGAGAFGRTVKNPAELLPALKAALDAVKNGKPAVLDVYLPRTR